MVSKIRSDLESKVPKTKRREGIAIGDSCSTELDELPRADAIAVVRRLLNLCEAIALDADRAQAEADELAPVKALIEGLLARRAHHSIVIQDPPRPPLGEEDLSIVHLPFPCPCIRCASGY